MTAISLPPFTAQAMASERIVLLSGPVMMLPALRSQMNCSPGRARTFGNNALSRGSMHVSATTGSSSSKSPGWTPAFWSPAIARWLASIMASNRRIGLNSSNANRSFRSPNKKIDGRPDEMQKQDYQHPADLFTISQTFIGHRVDEHPNPEDKSSQSQRPDDHEGQHSQYRHQRGMVGLDH